MATHNGGSTLPLTLEAFCGLDLPPEGAEFIIVDNASTDDTADILQSFADRLPLEIVRESRPGRTRALNTGLAQAKGELIVITDDDVIPNTDWLTTYRDAAQAYPAVSIFAGQVRHYWQKPPPTWLERLASEGLSYGGTASDREAGPIHARQIKGANFAARRSALQEHRFREDLGYGAGGDMVAGDEVEFAQRLMDAGHKSWFVPEACVQHIVRPYQIGIRPVLQRYFRIGRGIEATGGKQFGENLPTIGGYPRFLCRTLPPELMRAGGHFLRRDPYRGVRSFIDIAITCGRAYQWRQSRRKSP